MSQTLRSLHAAKTVGFLGGLALLFNQMTGPAIPFTGANFQDPGWAFTGSMFVVFALAAAFAGLFLVKAIQAIPGNQHFQGAVEFSTAVNFFFGARMHIAAQACLYAALQANAIQSIIMTAQTTDNLMIAVSGRACGLSFSRGWICTSELGYDASPFANEWMVFTLGLLIILLCTIPLVLVSFDDNITFNIATSCLSLALAVLWIVCAFHTGIDASRIAVARPLHMSYSLVVGTVLLNLACTTVIPSWLNIKRKDVSIHKLVWSVVVGTAFFCITLGVITALGFDLTGNTSVISALFSKGVPPGLARFSAGAFSFILLLPGIPVSFMVARNNLVQNRLVSPRTATFLAIFLPWFICIPLQTGNAIFHVQIWSSLLFSSPVNFIIPFLMYFRCLQFRREFNTKRILTVNQIELLHIIHHLSPPINDFLSSKRMRLLNGRRRPSDQDAPAPAGVAAAEPLRPAVDIPTILIVAPDSQNSADTLEQDQGVTAAISADQAQAPLSVVAADALPEPGHIEEGLAPLSTHLPLRLSTDSYGSRDSKVTLRLDCAETDEDVPFVNPQDAGLPSFIVDEDIPVETPRSAGSHQHPQHADLDFGYQPESPVASLPASPRVHTSHDLPRLSVETPQIVKTSGTGQRADSPYLHVYPMQDGLASMPLVEQARADHAKPTASTRPASPTPFLQVPSSQYLQLEHRPMILTLSIDSHERGRAASRDPSLLRVPGRSQSGSRSQSPTTYSPTRHSPTSNSPSHSPSQSPMFLQVPRLADLHGLHGWHSGSPEPRRVSFDERSFGGDSSTRRSASSCTTGHLSLPYEQEFTAAPFEILPAWFPVSEHTVAVFFVLVTSGICVCNMVMYAVMSLTSQ